MKMQNWLVAASIAAAVCLSGNNSLAQNNGGGGGGGGRRGGGGNFDPAQMRQRTLDRYKETLEVTKDDEWQALQPRIEKVMDARTAGGGAGRGMFGGGRRGGGAGGQNADANAQGGQQQRRVRPGQTTMPEAEALQKAIDAKAPSAELKAVLAKFNDARKARQDQLKAAQEDLRKLLTPRQEAIASLNGLL
jgi:Spy/CpxP family protein refolding chaperone